VTRKLAAVEVHWIDAHGGDLQWGTLTKRQHGPKNVRTVGQLQRDDKQGVTVALSADGQNYDCYIFIPRGCIVSVRKLK